MDIINGMQYVHGILATSHPDLDGEVIPEEYFETMLEGFKESYVPIDIQHDPRLPPQGRLVSAIVKRLDDGALAIEGVAELFEPGEEVPLADDPREIPVKTYDNLEVNYDRAFRDEESQAHIKAIATIFGSEAQETIKKSVDPVSVLTIGGAFAFAAFAGGFLQKMGSDTWDALKGHIKKLMERRSTVADRLLVLDISTEHNGQPLNIKAILTNPSEEDIDTFFQDGLRQIDELLPQCFYAESSVRQIVLGYSQGKILILFAVRKDAFPLYPFRVEE